MGTTGMKRAVIAGAVGLALVGTTLIATSGAAVAKTSARAASKCSVVTDDHWPAVVQGRPSGINPFTTGATYMWHDGDGWHIRVTHHTNNMRSFSGQLSTSGTFANVKPVQLEKSDQFQVSSDGHSITFLFKNYGHIDGLNFHTRCAPSISLSFQSDGSESPPSKIVIGHTNAHPPTDPFVVSRVAPTTIS
jgi:hypothetical protein